MTTQMTEEDQAQLSKLYQEYNNVIKPLLATIESKYEQFPTPLFNEIRAFNDHVAQCYSDEIQPDRIKGELRGAESHIRRIILDCFKFLNVYGYEYAEKFERKTKRIDLTTIDNGKFYITYTELRQGAKKAAKEAKLIERKNKVEAYTKFEMAFNMYSELEDLIDDNIVSVQWARVKFTIKTFRNILLWLLTAIISGIISSIVANNLLFEYLKKLLGLDD